MHKLVLALAVAFAAACCAMGQEADSLLRARQANFDRFAARYPQERVYLHFDNTSYYKGERIWYKAYVVDGGTFRATPLSRILYVELLNPMGYPVETQKLVISDGQADGAFTLSDTINAGFYEVRAYTAWMLNFTPGDRHGWRTLSSRSVCRRYGERFQRYLDGNAGVFSRVFPVYDAVEGGRYAIKRMPRQPKATVSLLEREKDKLAKQLGGIRNMNRTPSAMFVVDINKESLAVEEAHKLGIPVIAIVDTNTDPEAVEYPIPANDDAIRGIELLTSLMADAVADGLLERSGKATKAEGESDQPMAEWEKELLAQENTAEAPAADAQGEETKAE